jgi:hypothetical protein
MKQLNGSYASDMTINEPTSISGTVAGDLTVNAKTMISGSVAGDIIANAPLTISGSVAGDVTANATVNVSGSVAGDIVANGCTVVIEGTVNGELIERNGGGFKVAGGSQAQDATDGASASEDDFDVDSIMDGLDRAADGIFKSVDRVMEGAGRIIDRAFSIFDDDTSPKPTTKQDTWNPKSGHTWQSKTTTVRTGRKTKRTASVHTAGHSFEVADGKLKIDGKSVDVKPRPGMRGSSVSSSNDSADIKIQGYHITVKNGQITVNGTVI